MTNESADHTLQSTALVHDAWLRLVGDNSQIQFQNWPTSSPLRRQRCVAFSSTTPVARHGGEQKRVDIEYVELAAPDEDDQLLAVKDALEKLMQHDKVEGELVKLRYFVGLTNDEAAEVLGISPRTAKYYWTHARAWLFREIGK
jgi:DNA-directed RNA polymerase specialized sigma24 family protein